ncbi:MAG: DNA/RNA nuclease SfsA [Candidatus Caldatribacteriaceae bacterium]
MNVPLFQVVPLLEARFIARVNRFVVEVEEGKERFSLSINNTGRLENILQAGRRAFFVPHANRKTRGKLAGVEDTGGLAFLDTALQMKAFEVAFWKGLFPWLSRWESYRRNPRSGNSILDYLFVCGEKRAYAEIKSALFRKEDLALYPDAPTERGRKHLQTLMALQRQGFVTYFLLAVGLPQVVGFAPFTERDPEVARLLQEAQKKGVVVKSFVLRLSEEGMISLVTPDLPVFL